ncbi:hypothetical protein HanXRQr2_Chr02g0055311 [Helianthus annuus]|uniref:Uncharacterized protein n=1 Tax=Helianthus annuus TaxID=4232 RepID=A0A251RT32_HELAN|nr:hypothetical protein HanXRQr2_Chr02g0055311 [Helianthus annuus]
MKSMKKTYLRGWSSCLRVTSSLERKEQIERPRRNNAFKEKTRKGRKRKPKMQS